MMTELELFKKIQQCLRSAFCTRKQKELIVAAIRCDDNVHLEAVLSDISHEHFREGLERASILVERWPDWKKQIIGTRTY